MKSFTENKSFKLGPPNRRKQQSTIKCMKYQVGSLDCLLASDLYHLDSLFLSDSKLIGLSGDHKRKLRLLLVYYYYDENPSFQWGQSFMGYSFGNYLLEFCLFVLVMVFNPIQQTFIEHYYQALEDIKINKDLIFIFMELIMMQIILLMLSCGNVCFRCFVLFSSSDRV